MMNHFVRLALPLCLGAVAAASAADTKDIRKTVPLSPQGRVSIDTYKGRIHVIAWDQPQVEIHVRLEPDGWSQSDRDQVRDTDVRIDASSGDSVRVETRYPSRRGDSSWFGMANGNMALANYEIRMPRTAQLRIKDYKSDTDVSGLAAALEIETYKGDVRVSKQNGGAVSVKTYKSEARVEMTRVSDRMRFETYKGSYDVTLPQNAAFDLDWDGGRHASLHTAFATTRRAGGREGFRSQVRGGGPVMSLKGYRGDFRLH